MLGVPSITLAAPGVDIDAPLRDLLARWRAESALAEAADERFYAAEEASRVEPLASLIVTQGDHILFYPQVKEPVGLPFGESVIKLLAGVVACAAPVWGDSEHLRKIVDRFVEIRDALRVHDAAVEAARRSAGFHEREADQEAAREAEEALRREVETAARARTAPGLLAKLSAVANAFGTRQSLAEDTDFEGAESVDLDGLVLTVLRDCSAILGRAPA